MVAKLKTLAAACFLTAGGGLALAQQAQEPPGVSENAKQPEEKTPATATEFQESEFTTTANGVVVMDVAKNSPLYAEFEGSQALTDKLRESMAARGFVMTNDPAAAAAKLLLRGDVVLLGGPKFYKGVKEPVGKATERTLSANAGKTTAGDVARGALSGSLNAAAYLASSNNFMRGLSISGMASALGESTGAKGWFNTAVAGDPRGICMSRCEDWKKVNQTVYLWITLDSKGEAKQEVRMMTKVFSETVAPDQLIQFAVVKAFDQVKMPAANSESRQTPMVEQKKQ